MSFNAVTAFWIVKLFIIYTLMVVVFPCLVLRPLLKGRSWTQKFVISVVAGNFFYIMLVQLWGLIHITNRYVLILSTLAIPAVLIFRSRKLIWEKHLNPAWIHIRRFAKRENSFRYSMRIFLRWIRRGLGRGLKCFGRFMLRHIFELILFIGCSVFVLWNFSVTDHFGPMASDLVVHMYWINGVDDGILFRAGIYPFGMHSLMYYIHAVFDIPTVRIVLLFAPVQTFYIFTMLLAFLKEICRYRYTPYLSYVAFSMGSYLFSSRYSRYVSALPQEFGMIFLFPCAIAVILFFRAVRDENAEYKRMKKEKLLYTQIDGKRHWKESTIWLWVLIISFGLTLSAHFYITILAGLLVLSAAIAYIWFVLHPRTLRRLICAALISILIPVVPMAVSFATGTPLQGSLYWALSVMGVDTSDDEEEDAEDMADDAGETADADAAVASDSNSSGTASEAEDNTASDVDNEAVAVQNQTVTLRERVEQFISQAKSATANVMTALVFESQEYMQIWIWCIIVLLVEIPLMWLFRECEYSRYIIMVLIFNGLMLLLCIAGSVGLPTLIDVNRSTMFFCYIVTIVLSLAVDGCLVFLGRIIRVKWIWQLASLVMAASFVFYTVETDHVRIKTTSTSSLERDGAQLCVYDIMEKYPYQKWTIVSCNEERNMISPVAWHYEVIDFLESMENYKYNDEMYIPTQYVFFFVEKKSLDYAYGEFSEEEQPWVSEEWASQSLPAKNGLIQYQGTNRIILNSRMYYWAQEYQKRFPNEMKVYYEDEDFICYYIEQNEYYLNNFAIDYGYNSGGEAG